MVWELHIPSFSGLELTRPTCSSGQLCLVPLLSMLRHVLEGFCIIE